MMEYAKDWREKRIIFYTDEQAAKRPDLSFEIHYTEASIDCGDPMDGKLHGTIQFVYYRSLTEQNLEGFHALTAEPDSPSRGSQVRQFPDRAANCRTWGP